MGRDREHLATTPAQCAGLILLLDIDSLMMRKTNYMVSDERQRKTRTKPMERERERYSMRGRERKRDRENERSSERDRERERRLSYTSLLSSSASSSTIHLVPACSFFSYNGVP